LIPETAMKERFETLLAEYQSGAITVRLLHIALERRDPAVSSPALMRD